MSNASFLTLFLRTVAQIALIAFTLLLAICGVLGLIFGRLHVGRFHLKSPAMRILSALLLLSAAAVFIPKYGLLVESLLALALGVAAYFVAERPDGARPLPAGTHTFQSGPDEPAYRLHLRLMKDGSGILIVNAATVLHLNATAAECAYHMMKGTAPEEAARQIAGRYHISPAAAQKDFLDFRERVQLLIHTPDLDPTAFLDFERVAPHSKDLTAPLRLDCALTYQLPSGTRADYAPTKRVDRELITQEWETILDKAWAAGIPHITFTGGEATLREDLPQLIAHAEKVGQVTGLLSDGLKLANKAYRTGLLQAGLDHLLFILQPDEPKSWRALEAIMPEDLYTTVHLTMTPQNIGRAEEYLKRLAKLEVKSLSLGASDASLREAMHAMHNRAAEYGLTLRWDLPVPYSFENPVAHETLADRVPSGAGKAWLYVEPDGDVLPTQGEADKILGNILRDPWEKIYR
jgi:hypothetical protein